MVVLYFVLISTLQNTIYMNNIRIYKLAFLLLLSISCSTSSDAPVIINEPDTPIVVIEPIPCDECSHVVDNWKTDGTVLNIQPGDIICLDGTKDYNNLTFTNLKGSPTNPIIIKNCGGNVAVINPTNSPFGIKFQYSHDFKLIGNGGGGDYGIKISTDDGFFLTMQTYTTDFEIAHVEIAGKTTDRSGFAGIGIKTSPYEDCDVFTDQTKMAWVMRNIVVRDNYIHDTGGEGMYIGHGFYNGRTESQCSERTYSHSIKNLRVFNNKLENIGLDGIQIKNADENVEVYNNFIDGYAKDDDTGAHDEGILIGDGTTGKFYNNTIMDGGTGIMVHGMGNLDIYNNVIYNVHDYAFFAASGPSVYRIPDGYFNIFNNTFYSEGQTAFAFFDAGGGSKRLKNNIFVAPNVNEFTSKGVALDSSNNIFTKDISFFKFIDFFDINLNLKSDSPAIDAGEDLSSFNVDTDILGTTRPQGEGFDLGAYEFKNP